MVRKTVQALPDNTASRFVRASIEWPRRLLPAEQFHPSALRLRTQPRHHTQENVEYRILEEAAYGVLAATRRRSSHAPRTQRSLSAIRSGARAKPNPSQEGQPEQGKSS